MAQIGTPHYKNDEGHNRIEIGVKKFMCVGATPPYDHPHVFLDMGDDTEKVCPYCSTLYVFNEALADGATIPENCLFTAPRAA
ncbi:MAG: zinc-finger domain-containing protein [Pseudomonadota bacterium]